MLKGTHLKNELITFHNSSVFWWFALVLVSLSPVHVFFFIMVRSWRRESWRSSAPLWCFSPSAWVMGVEWHQLKVRAWSPSKD